MSISFFDPLVLAVLIAVIATVLQRRLSPHVAAPTLAIASVAVAAGIAGALFTMVLGALAANPELHDLLSWCPTLHHAEGNVSWWVGVTAAIVLSAALTRVALTLRSQHRTRRRLPTCEHGLLIIESPQPTAYAVPGRNGGVVVSTGMIEALEPPERAVLWAHERSHLAHRHHRYLVATEIAAAMVPPLRRLARQVQFATERWADEDAAREVGGDRNLVARAIARAALASVDHQRSAMALAETGVGERVRAMVTTPRGYLAPLLGFAAGLLVIGFSVAGLGVQLHHVVAFIDHACHVF